MIIFDLDGTLWDTCCATHIITNEVVKESGYNYEVPYDVIYKSMGLNFEDCANNYFPTFDDNDKKTMLMKAFERVVDLLDSGDYPVKIYDNVYTTLEKLSKKFLICIVSNCSQEKYIEDFINLSGVNKFICDYVAASKYNISKSDAIKNLIKKYSIDKAIYVGDTSHDLEASKMAKIDFVYCKYGFGKNVVCKYSINQINDLVFLVESIF